MLDKGVVVALAISIATPAAADEWPAPPSDIAAFPPATVQPERPLGFELHGAVVPWWTPWSSNDVTAWRFRLAILRFDARPMKGLSVNSRIGFHLEGSSPLLDLSATYNADPRLGITFGQFRMPLGAAATTLGPSLAMLDRPVYVNTIHKQNFRDLGVMLHGPMTGQRGVHWRLAFASGSGRIGTQQKRPPDEHQYLIVARTMYEHRFSGARTSTDRLVLGATSAVSRDPAVDTGDAATDASAVAGVLGRMLAPIDHERTSVIGGGDATLSFGPWWLQGEALYLRSRADDGSITKRAAGASLELGFTLPHKLGDHTIQLVARNEWFDPDRGVASNERDDLVIGANVGRGRLRWSAFSSVGWMKNPASGRYDRTSELTLRAIASF